MRRNSFTMPETEDRATVERVKTVAKEIGGRLKALKPDLWLIFANDHAEQYFHNVAPPFTVHVGASASGHSPVAISTGKCRAKSALRSSRAFIARGSTRPSPVPLRSTTRWASR
jgi:hypothetical protein